MVSDAEVHRHRGDGRTVENLGEGNPGEHIHKARVDIGPDSPRKAVGFARTLLGMGEAVEDGEGTLHGLDNLEKRDVLGGAREAEAAPRTADGANEPGFPERKDEARDELLRNVLGLRDFGR